MQQNGARSPQMVDEHADARPRLELDRAVLGADRQAAADVVHRDGPAEEQEGVDRDLDAS